MFLFRIQIVVEGKKRKLIIKNCKLDDTSMISCKVPGDESSAPLDVMRKYSATWIILGMCQPDLFDSSMAAD